MADIHLTSRAFDDLQEIYDYSVINWGEKIAAKYIKDFQDTFSILQENPGLLKLNKQISTRFKIYPDQKHYLVCDTFDDNIFILTIKQVSMNLLDRLKKLEPNLNEETRIMYRKIQFDS